MKPTLRIDFVSDVSCPWCAVGLASLEQALATLAPELEAELHFQPFELNPQMGPDGEDMTEHLSRKYGSSPEDLARNRAAIGARGAAVGFHFHPDGRGRIQNTFNAHRLLHWAGAEGTAEQQHALKKALLEAHHGRAENPADPAVLLRAVESVGLDVARARAIVDSDEYAMAVREAENFFTSNGIRSVPAVIIDHRPLISGGQPPEVFERALRQIAGLPPEAGVGG